MEARYRQHSPCPLWCFIQSKGMVTRYEVPKIQKMNERMNGNHYNLSVWTEPLPVAPSKTPSFCTITEKRFMSAVMQSRGQFVSSHVDCSSYTTQGKNNLANLTMPFSSPGQRARGSSGQHFIVYIFLHSVWHLWLANLFRYLFWQSNKYVQIYSGIN